MDPPDPGDRTTPPPNLDSWLACSGEMGRLISEFDWGKTTLGPIDRWPQSLLTTVRLMVGSRYPMFLWWGNELINLYNDAYISVLGKRHPSALGSPASVVWSEIWHIVGVQADHVLSCGQATWNQALLLSMERNGYPEETYFTWSYSPARDDRGDVRGVFCACMEETGHVLSDRRMGTLREMATNCVHARTILDTCHAGMAAIEGNPYDMPFALLYLLDADGVTVSLSGAANWKGPPILSPEKIMLTQDAGLWPIRRVLEHGQKLLMSEFADLGNQWSGGPWPESPTKAMLLPIRQGGQTVSTGCLIVGLSPRLEFNEPYRDFLQLVAAQIGAALANAQAYEDERKRAEALAELDRAKTAFFSNISHEFRTPLTLMLGPMEDLLARRHGDVPPSAFHELEVINRNALRLMRLVNSLLDFSRIEAGRVQALYVPTDLAAFTADLAASFRSAIERAGLRLVLECQTLPESVYVDRDMWEKIVLNLVSNAFKFTFEGEIAVSLRQVGRTAELCVRDTGMGISTENLNKVFNRFHRVEHMRSRTYEGAGIGLALVQELVNLHGGRVRVESRGLNTGSSFIVTVPLGASHLPSDHIGVDPTVPRAGGADLFVEEALQWCPVEEEGLWKQEADASSGDGSPESGQSGDRRSRILVVDDNADMREYLTRILSLRYEVIAVKDGIDAVAALNRRSCDLVLSDVMMPRLDGFGLLQQLRNTPATRTLPVILLSARAGEDARVEGLDQGADDYLIKPFSVRELMARVDSHLKLQHMRREAETETQKFISLVENSGDFIGMCDLAYQPFYINAAGLAMVGLENLHQAQRIPVKDFFFTDDQACFLNDVLPRALRDGRADTEIRFRHFLTGEALWMMCSVFQLLDFQGRPVGLATVSRNITERKQIEEALARGEERFRRVFEFAGTGIAISDLRGRFEQCNPAYCRLLGYSQDELRDMDFASVVHPDDQAANLAEILRLKDREVPFFEIENRYIRKDGTPVWVHKHVSVLRNETGAPTHLVKLVTDITARREAEDRLHRWKNELERRVAERTKELRASQHRLRSLASQLSLTEQRERLKLAGDLHDNLTQLLVLGVMKLELAMKRSSLTPDGRGLLEEVNSLLQEALAYSRTMIAELGPPTRPDSGIGTTLQWLKAGMQKHGLCVEIETNQEDIRVPESRSVLLVQAVRELLMNVRKHAGVDRAMVRVTAGRDGAVEISVKDRGKGLSADAMQRAMEPGHLGLFAVWERMEAIGGRVEVTSCPDHGTTVSLLLPAADSPPSGTADKNDPCNH